MAQIAALRLHDRERERPESLRNLAAALRAATEAIAAGRSLPAPRTYQTLAETGTAWVILAMLHEQADIPRRLSPHPLTPCPGQC